MAIANSEVMTKLLDKLLTLCPTAFGVRVDVSDRKAVRSWIVVR